VHQCITGEIKEICNKMNQSDEEQMPSVNPPPPGIVRFVDVRIYDVPAEDLPEGPFSVESTLKAEEEPSSGKAKSSTTTMSRSSTRAVSGWCTIT
jgi:hypothetical protein